MNTKTAVVIRSGLLNKKIKEQELANSQKNSWVKITLPICKKSCYNRRSNYQKGKIVGKRTEYFREYFREYRKNKEYRKKANKYSKEYYRINKETLLAKQKEMDRLEYFRKYMKERRKNPKWKLLDRARTRLYSAIKNKQGIKSKKTLELLGVKDFQEVINHLVSQFREGMTLDNYGQWHVDHIKPCSSFNLLDVEEQKKCFHYTNLQPLWARENLSKGNRCINT